MLQKPKNWIAETLWKPKKTHSLEQLRYLHYILQRNSLVSESNKSLLIETLRSIAEILIWGDQNDSTVFDFFLEKNMLLFFLKFMTQNCGNYVTVQLLQTLNILFENIRHETSIYFLLSNNHVNSIIVHKFDFANEEVLAYYISFLKTLSLKLNMQTINFFFNEKKSDFPLYTEAIKFFHHPEGMVRIAVRTLTLNVYKVGHQKMLEFICDKTATPYFSNLIWLIGKDAIELDDCVVQEADHFKFDKLKSLVANHLDHLHYLNDIMALNIEVLNMILTDHMINRLLIPLYIYSLPSGEDLGKNNPERVCISKLVALFLLAQHLLIINHKPLACAIVDVIFNEDEIRSTAYTPATPDVEDRRSLMSNGSSSSRAFIPPPAPLESQLEACGVTRDTYNLNMKLKMLTSDKSMKRNSTFYIMDDGTIKQKSEDGSDVQSDADESLSESYSDLADESYPDGLDPDDLLSLAQEADKRAADSSSENIEKVEVEPEQISSKCEDTVTIQPDVKKKAIDRRSTSKKCRDNKKDSESSAFGENSEEEGKQWVFIKSILKSLDCNDSDSEGFFALCLVYSIIVNKGLNEGLRTHIGLTLPKEAPEYDFHLMDRLLSLLEQGVRDGSRMRIVTFEMCILIVRLLTIEGDIRRIKDHHFAMIQNIREASTLQLRSFYKGEDLFVDTFEGQYHHMKAKPINVEYITMDASLLLPPTVTPLTGIDFIKRLPCGDQERTQRATHIFILMRELMLDLQRECEHLLPLSKILNPVNESQVLDLNNSDLIACTIVQQGKHNRRFLVIDTNQFILVEPDTTKLGWGVVKFVCHLQDVEANPDKDDSRSLHIVIQQPFARRSKSGYNPLPVMTAKFLFDDYIRCMSARQRLQKRSVALRHTKITTIATLLELPALAAPPSHYYSFTNIDGSNSVWSPSSRGYSATKNGSSTSSSSSSPSLGSQRPKLLSPKHEEILLKKGSKVDGNGGKTSVTTPPSKLTLSSISHLHISEKKRDGELGEAGSLAALLRSSPPSCETYEVTGRYTGKNMRTNSTTEVGEEVGEDIAFAENTSDSQHSDSSSHSITSKNSISRTGRSRTGFKEKPRENEKGKRGGKSSTSSNIDFNTSHVLNASSSNTSNTEFNSFERTSLRTSLDRSTSSVTRAEVMRKFSSAPASPRGRRCRIERSYSGDTIALSKSLPAMALGATSEERRTRAQRARAKSRIAKTRGGKKAVK